ncbi:hypothetical protein EG329_004621 [Mollisiaceae sp. DMI_Dod_QoI]|nr:hypothetical protein EG329_004621 [Helotiales sp. DMI_Dod_QoI]
MAYTSPRSLPWHAGEKQMLKILHLPLGPNPNSPFLSPGAGYMIENAPLLALGALDDENRPWTGIYGGEEGFARPIGKNIIGVNTLVDRRYDPVVNALLGASDEDDEVVVEEEGGGKLVGGLTIDLETRGRVKLHGRMVAGALGVRGEQMKEDEVRQMQLVVNINKSLGNCPKYLNKKHIVPAMPHPKLISDSPQLPPEALSLLEKADLFFISSTDDKASDMDTNHRGGPAGLIRVLSNSPTGAVLIYPEYSGNRLYETLGNLQIHPLAGITVPDFDTGSVLYATGRTEILIGEAASSLLLRSNLAVKFTITSALFISHGLSFTGIPGTPSPYNPPVRYAFNEPSAPSPSLTTTSATATLISYTPLTPTISRFLFKLSSPPAQKLKPWKPGQYATLSFSSFLDKGYSHMRDDDPKSLNDDYLRTFTVSNAPSAAAVESGICDAEFEVTVRNVGRVTGFLFQQGRKLSKGGGRKGVQVPMMGFEGEFRFERERMEKGEGEKEGKIFPFIAGGIGITPVLSQLQDMNIGQLRLLWGIGLVDIGLVADTLKRYPELVPVTTLFLTGEEADVDAEQRELFEQVKGRGVRVERRRVERRDVERVNEEEGVC